MCCTIKKVMIAVGVLGAVFIVLGAVLGFAVFPTIVDDEIEATCRLEEGTEQYERWEQLPFPLTFKVYVFKVKNAQEIMEGDQVKPIVEEVGPYVFNQYRKKHDILYNEEADTLTYKQYLHFEFDPVASMPLTLEDEHTVLNVPLQGVLQTAEQTGLAGTANNAYQTAFPDGDSLFHTISMDRFFFGGSGGYTFCDPATIGNNIIVKLFCGQVRSQSSLSQTLTVDDNDVVHFSFFSHKNNNYDGVYEINAGNDDIHQVGAILSWNGNETIGTWDDSVSETSRCNVVRGRDSSIYPPFNNDTSEFDVFNTDICRIVQLKTTSTATYKDIEGNFATLGKENFKNTDDKACYCTKGTYNLDGKAECLPDGFADMKTCLGAPVVASFPHLLDVDQQYRDTVEGLSPDRTKHQTYVTMEPATGSPLQGGKRLQFNMFLRPIEKITATEKFARSVLPILWVEEGVQLSDELVQKIKDDYLSKLVLIDVVTWVLIGIGIALLVASLGYFLFAKMC